MTQVSEKSKKELCERVKGHTYQQLENTTETVRKIESAILENCAIRKMHLSPLFGFWGMTM